MALRFQRTLDVLLDALLEFDTAPGDTGSFVVAVGKPSHAVTKANAVASTSCRFMGLSIESGREARVGPIG
jgi:hypothetical protein